MSVDISVYLLKLPYVIVNEDAPHDGPAMKVATDTSAPPRKGPALKKTDVVSLTDRVYAALKADIVSGHYPPGGLIDANDVASTIGVSRTPVREALLRLANEGAVEVSARRGVRVKPLTADDLQNLYEVISALEIQAVTRLAVREPQKADLAPLVEQLVRMRLAIELADGDAWNLADEAFHRALFDLCGNPRLREAGHNYRDAAQRAHFVALRLVSLEQKADSVAAHARLIDDITTGDPDIARKSHGAQRARGGDLLVSALRELGLTQF